MSPSARQTANKLDDPSYMHSRVRVMFTPDTLCYSSVLAPRLRHSGTGQRPIPACGAPRQGLMTAMRGFLDRWMMSGRKKKTSGRSAL